MLKQNTSNTFFLETTSGKTPINIVYEYCKQATGSKQKPVVVFLHGLHSDMFGNKAESLKVWCKERGVGFARLEYSGHGSSGGEFVDFTISKAIDAAQHLLNNIIKQPVVLVGSSTGGWLTLLLAKACPKQVKGIVSIANACDFTETWWKSLTKPKQQKWQQSGVLVEEKYEDEVWEIGYELINDGRKHLLFDNGKLAKVTCPIRLLHGLKDEAVPWQVSVKVAEQLGGDDVVVELYPNSTHRFGEPKDIDALCAAVDDLPVWN